MSAPKAAKKSAEKPQRVGQYKTSGAAKKSTAKAEPRRADDGPAGQRFGTYHLGEPGPSSPRRAKSWNPNPNLGDQFGAPFEVAYPGRGGTATVQDLMNTEFPGKGGKAPRRGLAGELTS